MSQLPWFKIRTYPHIGLPIRFSDRKNVYMYITNRNKIKHHPFLPLIYREIKSERYRRDSINAKKSRADKVRPICYANHLDACIYAYYSSILQTRYEKYLNTQDFSSCVTAYRRIPSEDNLQRNKCNIDLAKEVFTFAKQKAQIEDVAVLTFDIHGFFDNLDPILLKKSWMFILGEQKSLPVDHYNVYKNVIYYSYIYEKALFSLFKDEIICRKGDRVVRKKIKRSCYMHNHNAVAYCEKKDIRKIQKSGLIISHKAKSVDYQIKGIPQGLPISAVLANIYMIDFDKDVNEKIKSYGNNKYSRYSDDIIVICSKKNAQEIKRYILENIKKLNLEIQEKKTHIFYLKKHEDNNVYCEHEYLGFNKPLEYLGFQFDGRKILLKSASISLFYSKMIRSINRGGYYAAHTHNTQKRYILFTRKLYRRFSRFGAKRKLIYQRDSHDHSLFKRTTKIDWGNYLAYVYNAAYILGEPSIKNQLKHSGSILARGIRRKVELLGKIFYARLFNNEKI